jgi:O-acetylhomoserine/O-acetylserine sulfhydrylase-like pyridoxal-dependent enzyme
LEIQDDRKLAVNAHIRNARVQQNPKELKKAGVEDMLRLTMEAEHVEDLIEDLERAG